MRSWNRYLSLLISVLVCCGCTSPTNHSVSRPTSQNQPPSPPSESKTPPSTPSSKALEGRDLHQEALAAIHSQDWKTAQTLLEQVTAQNPTSPDAWNDLAYVHIFGFAGETKALEKAVSAADHALKLKPNWAPALYNHGLAQLGLGHDVAAVSSLALSASQQPDSPDAHLAWGLALIGSGDTRLAMKACKTADQLKSTPLSQDCLQLLSDNLPQIPASELSLPPYLWRDGRYDREGGWTGVTAEVLRVNPPQVCGNKYPDGFTRYFLVCSRGEKSLRWEFAKPFEGKTSKGVGMGVTLDHVTALWGAGAKISGDLCYGSEGLKVCVKGDNTGGVTRLIVSNPQPNDLIDRLFGRTPPKP